MSSSRLDRVLGHLEPQPLAARLAQLGTETAYAVSAEAAVRKAAGHKVFPFHIGDLNVRTASAVAEKAKEAINEGKTGYVPAMGILPLREAAARHCGAERGVSYTADNVCVQAGGKPTIEKFLLCVMNEGDEVMYPSPGYPIYESLIRFYGGVPVPYVYKEEKDGSLVLDMEHFISSVSKKTCALIYNNQHNPTGHQSSPQEMKKIADFAVANNLWVLSDEAYFHIHYNPQPVRSIASLPGMVERTVILVTCSKAWSMTGWRVGVALGPEHIIQKFGKLATNFEGCVTNFNQWAAIECFSSPTSKPYIQGLVQELDARRMVLHQLINEVPGFRAALPRATFYTWINVTKAFEMLGIEEGPNAYEDFRKLLLEKTGVSFCTREHFGQTLPGEREKYIRFAYSGISVELIREAVATLKSFMTQSR